MQTPTKVKDLLKLIDRNSPLHPNEDNILAPASTLFQIITQKYNSYKKSNELKILQNKVYSLKIKDEEESMDDESKANVSISSLCMNFQMDSQSIDSLLAMKEFLAQEMRKEVIYNVVRELQKMDDFQSVLNSFRKILKTQECLKNADSLYKNVQSSMITKILSFDLSAHHFELISKFILSLPYIRHNPSLLQFIANLFDKTQRLEDFASLNKIYSQISITKGDTVLEEVECETKIKITTPENIEWVLRRAQESGKQSRFFAQLFEECSHKMSELVKRSERVNARQMDEQIQFSDKDKSTIQLIFIALQHCEQLWENFIKFHSLIGSNFQHYCNQKIYHLISLNSSTYKVFIKKLSKPILSFLINFEQQRCISHIFWKEILRIMKEEGQEIFMRNMLANKSVRQFLAIKCMVLEEQNVLLEDCGYVDIFLEMFSFPTRCVLFFKTLLENSVRKQKLEYYLHQLLEAQPNKFKEFFIKIDQTCQGEIFEHQVFYLVRFLKNVSTPSIAVSIIREMCSYPPSRFCISIMEAFSEKFIASPEIKTSIISQCVRTLNLILVTRKYDQFTTEFKNHLEEYSRKFKTAEQIFRHVPKEMIEDLKKFYEQKKM